MTNIRPGSDNLRIDTYSRDSVFIDVSTPPRFINECLEITLFPRIHFVILVASKWPNSMSESVSVMVFRTEAEFTEWLEESEKQEGRIVRVIKQLLQPAP